MEKEHLIYFINQELNLLYLKVGMDNFKAVDETKEKINKLLRNS